VTALCHEIVHIRNGDSLRLGVLQGIDLLGEKLRQSLFRRLCRKKILAIETQTDREAAQLLARCFPEEGPYGRFPP